jgi:hypothetical protein
LDRSGISFIFFKKNIHSRHKWFIPDTNGAVSAGKNAINSVGNLISALYVIFHEASSMLSAALKVCEDVTAADDALAFLVSD